MVRNYLQCILVLVFLTVFTYAEPVVPPNYWASTINEHYGAKDSGDTHKVVHKQHEHLTIDRGAKKEKHTSLIEATPGILEFQERWICTAVVSQLNLTNQSTEDLHVYSITVDSIHFHITFFKEHRVAPNNRTSISVVFLPRTIGPIEASFFVETSFGKLMYHARGRGIPNPYMLHPLVGTKIPFGLPHSPSISLYNPRSHPIQVTEVFTSGGFLHLLLPTNNSKSASAPSSTSSLPQSLWRVDAHSNKTIINLNFELASIGKYQGFVNIKVEDVDLPNGSESMILHVEVTVVKNEVHVQFDDIDFGVLMSPNSTSSASLVVLNAGNTAVTIVDIAPLVPDDMLDIDLIHPIVLPGENTSVAMLRYNGKSGISAFGKIMVHTNDSQRMEVVYRASVVHGYLKYNVSNTFFAIGRPPFQTTSKVLTFQNMFPIPIALYSIEIEDSRFAPLIVSDFSPGMVALPDASWPSINITFQGNQSEMIYTRLHITTNLTSLFVPLQAYTGRLLCVLPTHANCACPSAQTAISEPRIGCPAVLDFGVFSVGESRNITINIANPNPMNISIYDITSNNNCTSFFVQTFSNARGKIVYEEFKRKSSNNAKPRLQLTPGQTAVLVVVVKPNKEEQAPGHLVIQTSPSTFERIPLIYRAVEGAIAFTPSKLSFDFPANISGSSLHRTSESIFASSSCGKPVRVISVSVSSPLFSVSTVADTIPPTIAAPVLMFMVDFNPAGLATESSEHSLASSTTELHKFPNTVHTVTLHVHTDLLGVYEIELKANVGCLPNEIDFGVVKIGSIAAKTIPFHNPTASDMWVTISIAQKPHTAEWDIAEYEWGIRDFAIDTALAQDRIFAPAHKTVLVGPILFSPQQAPLATLKSHAILLVLNNFSDAIATAELRGEGGAGKLVFLRGEEVQSQLVFELDTDACRSFHPVQPPTFPYVTFSVNPISNSQVPPMDIFRSLEIVNVGNLGVNVERVGLNGKSCISQGFSVHNCTEQFYVDVGQRKTLFISFAPDFSASLIRRELVLHSSQGLVVIPIVARFDYEQLAQCNDYQNSEHNQLLRFIVLAVLCSTFAFLAIFIMREYCSASESKIPDVRTDENTFSYVNQPLPNLPELDPVPTLEKIEKLDKLTYEGYHPTKKLLIPKVGIIKPIAEKPIQQESVVSHAPQAYVPIPPPTSYTPYTSFSSSVPYQPGLLPDPPQPFLQQLHRASPPFAPIHPIQTPLFSVRPPSPYVPGILKPAVMRPLQTDLTASETPSPPVSPVPPFVKPERKKKAPEKSQQSASNDSVASSHQVPKPPPLPVGPLSHSATEFVTKKKSWNLRSQSDSALLNVNEGMPARNLYVQSQQLPQPQPQLQQPQQPQQPQSIQLQQQALQQPQQPLQLQRRLPKVQPQAIQSASHTKPTPNSVNPHISAITTTPTPVDAKLLEPKKVQYKSPQTRPILQNLSQAHQVQQQYQSTQSIQPHSPQRQLTPVPPPQPQNPWSPQQTVFQPHAQHNRVTNKSPSSPTHSNNTTNNANNSTALAYNLSELKKRGIHRRDLVKGSTALPPNMAFVPKKRPEPVLSPSPPPATRDEPPTESPAPHGIRPIPASNPLSQGADTDQPNLHLPQEVTEGERADSIELADPVSVGSLGGVSLRGINTQRKDTVGVIGSGKSINSPPTPPPFQFNNNSSMSSFLTSIPGSTASPSSLFSGSRSPLHFSSPIPIPIPVTSSSPLRNSSPLPNNNSTYDLFAPSVNPLFTPAMFDTPPIPNSPHPGSFPL